MSGRSLSSALEAHTGGLFAWTGGAQDPVWRWGEGGRKAGGLGPNLEKNLGCRLDPMPQEGLEEGMMEPRREEGVEREVTRREAGGGRRGR